MRFRTRTGGGTLLKEEKQSWDHRKTNYKKEKLGLLSTPPSQRHVLTLSECFQNSPTLF